MDSTDKKNKTKFYLTIGIIVTIILVAWFLNFKNIIQTKQTNKHTEPNQNWQEITNNLNFIVNDFKNIKNSLSQSPTSSIVNLQNTIKFSPDKIDEITNQLKNKNSTTDWQTYTNEKYNFEFKYPSTWNESWEVKNMDNKTCFYVAEYNNRQGKIFCIIYIPVTEWDNNNYKENNRLHKIGKNNNYIFYISTPLETHTYTATPNPYDVNSQIISTFKFLK